MGIKEITIKRLEGYSFGMDNRELKTDSWKDANFILLELSQTAPKDGTYDKTKFTIEFENGVIYKGRYDLMHHSVEKPDLFEHVKDNVLYEAGLNKPSWLSEKEYRRTLEHIEEYKRFAIECLGLDI